MRNYIHKVNYYETDKMGITHHSKYSYEELELKLQEYDLLIYEHLNDEYINNQYFKEHNLKSKNKIIAPK